MSRFALVFAAVAVAFLVALGGLWLAFGPEAEPVARPVRNPANPPRKVAQVVIKVTAEQLYQAYQSDLAAGAAAYTGKTLELTIAGVVDADAEGRLCVAGGGQRVTRGAAFIVKGNPAEAWRLSQQAALDARVLPCVAAYLDPRKAGAFAGRKAGTFTVRGICRGAARDQDTTPDLFVTADGCELVSAR